MQSITQQGAFTADTQAQINGNFSVAFGSTFGNNWFVNTVSGIDQNTGLSPLTPFRTMTAALLKCKTHDFIYVTGQLREECVTPLTVSGVTIVGANTRPRYGFEAGNQLDAAATWRPPVIPTAVTPLLTVRSQGWRLVNILVDCPVDAAGVLLSRTAGDAFDASSFSIYGCQFSDGLTGIQDVGGCYNYVVDSCRFQALTNAITCTSTAQAIPLLDTIQNCVFRGNTNDISSSFTGATIQNNNFMTANTITINTIFNAGQGGNNFVINNYVNDVAADIDPGNGYTGSATDVWRTFTKDQADPVITSPPV